MKEIKQDSIEDFLSEPKENKIRFDFNEYKSYAYSIVFFICGLVLGSFIYKNIQSDAINNLIVSQKDTFVDLFLNKFCIYFSIFLVTMFLGFSIFGFPLVNVVPMIVGIVYGMILAYYYINYSAKGVGYSLLMIIPSASILMSVVSMTIKVSSKLSKSIFDVSTKKTDIIEVEFKLCLKKYMIYAIVIVLTALINAGIVTIFSPLIKL